MMIIVCNYLRRLSTICNYHLMFTRTMFIRSIDKSKSKNWSQQQPYNKFFVLDFEATCDDKAHLLKPQEIIEFPCILVEFSTVSRNFEVLSYFHSYVKPIIHTELTEYCSQLTGITQDMICNSPLFDEVFQNFCKWYINQVNDEDKSIIVTSGNWDLGNIFVEQCKLFPSTVKIPEFMCTWINIKKKQIVVIMEIDQVGKWPEHVGILALELIVPSRYVNQIDLELHDGVSKGKYTIGLGQERMAFCSDREDVVSLCLTAVSSLMLRTQTSYSDIGRLEVGTETLVDKSKSIKSMLMRLFKNSNNNNVEGVDSTNACYGGTAALFNSVAWLESSAWDGRLAIVVAADVATYAQGGARPTGGAGAVAMLIGPNAPLVLDRGLRASHMDDTYDFYKGNMHTNYPLVDGKLSVQCYFEALYNCYCLYRKKFLNKFANDNETNTSSKSVLQHFDAIIFHSPYGKLVRKAFTWLTLHDLQIDANFYKKNSNLLKYKLTDINVDLLSDPDVLKDTEQLFKKLTEPTQKLPRNIGNMYTASVFGGLISYLISKPAYEMGGQRIAMFSFGSGMCSSFYSINIRSGEKLDTLISHLVPHVAEKLEKRHCTSPAEFENILKIRELTYNKAPFEPTTNIEDLFPGSWYLTYIDSMFRRYYSQ
ncbi:hydroxymethylglutaryl-CoA synthase 1-like isoform X3 [Sipha flava]|uniref:Hydroxymethylglutaryl-CoA synthase n=1 Tax=Sipha flava TaxID=143950 RepID=A0A8B8FWC5_9HEMI|nr:hydroxymethylglutaryl-CoA synthase 1-like isoform X3 [Sipha flava]